MIDDGIDIDCFLTVEAFVNNEPFELIKVKLNELFVDDNVVIGYNVIFSNPNTSLVVLSELSI
jgi:hypothetical protein